MNQHPDIAAVVAAFESALRDRGIDIPPGGIVADGRRHRTGTLEKPRVKDASYILHLDAYPAGTFVNNRDGIGDQNWTYGKAVAANRAELEAHIAEVARSRSRRNADRAAESALATASCKALWESATQADPAHPYLVRKVVLPHGVRQQGADLLVPMRNAKGELVGLQTILAEKSGGKDKLYAKGVPTTGLYHSIGKPDPAAPIICVCEGYATGASIHECTGHSVAVAFDCGNLEPVTQAIRVKFPHARIVVCCDDDWKQKLKNPGRVKGEAAAGAWDGVAVWPVWPDGYVKRGSDFNDLHTTLGAEAVRTQIARALAPRRVEMTMPEPAPEPAPSTPPSEDAELTGGMWAPEPFCVSLSGTIKQVMRDGLEVAVEVAPVPVWVAGVRVDANEGTHAVVVRWLERGATRELVVTRGLAAVARSITAIADQGFPVTSNTAALMVEYIATATHAWMSRESPAAVARISRLTGWHDTAFLAGTTRIGPNCPSFESPDANMTAFVTRIQPKGTAGAWRDAVNDALTRHPDLAPMIAAMVSSMLLKVLPAKPFFLDLAADTSTGKTTAISVAGTVWADTDWRIKWDGTPTGIERHIAATRDVGIIIDETQSADRPEHVISLVYKATTDIGRVRGAQAGGTAKTETLRSVVVSTGEQPIPDFGAAGGARARVLTIAGPPWGTGTNDDRLSDEIVDDQRRVLRVLRANYGHAGPMCAGWLSALTPDQLETIRDKYETQLRRRMTDAAVLSPNHPIGPRLCEYAALLDCAGALLFSACGVSAPHGWIPHARWIDMLERGRGADVARSAMYRLVSWALSRSASLANHPDAKGHAPSQGWIGSWDAQHPKRPSLSIGVTQGTDMLKSAGVQVGAAVSSWVARGWIEGGNGGSKASRVSWIGGGAMRVWRLTPTALAQFVWMPESETAPTPRDADLPL